jgi:hypothetical protein
VPPSAWRWPPRGGSATAATALGPGIRMIGVEPEAGDDTKRSLLAGRRVIISGGNINTQRFTELCGR